MMTNPETGKLVMIPIVQDQIQRYGLSEIGYWDLEALYDLEEELADPRAVEILGKDTFERLVSLVEMEEEEGWDDWDE